MQIRELSLKELESAYELITLLYTELSYQEFEDLIYDMRHIEYKMLGIFEEDELISYAGVSIRTDLLYKRHLYIYEFISVRQKEKYDALLFEYLIDYAKMGMCAQLVFAKHFALELLQKQAQEFRPEDMRNFVYTL